MYQSICVIGVGTLGSFVAKAISELEEIKKLFIVDYDKVEEKNILTSIYRTEDIGKYKTDSLEQYIKRENLEVVKMNEKYDEGITKLPKIDLIIDCRDFTYDRFGEIDFRLYISSRSLVVDCRKVINYDSHIEGKYTSHINKSDLRYAGFIVSMLVHRGDIKSLMKSLSVETFELDTISTKIQTSISRREEDRMYEPQKIENRIINLKETFNSIIDYNKEKDITICLGNYSDYNLDSHILKNTIRTYQDVVNSLNPLITLPYSHNVYVISQQIINNKVYIELLPETGAA